MLLSWLLAQTAPAATAPADAASALDNLQLDVARWTDVHRLSNDISAVTTLLAVLAIGWILAYVFRRLLQRHQLVRTLRAATVAVAVYLAVFVLHPYRMVDSKDLLALIIHRAFIAVMALVAVRLFDRLVIVPVLTRNGRVQLSRFVHQIVVAVISLFVVLGYCSWSFGVDISSFIAGSAVLSIVLGLALQETLGNFFSGMVMQASSPFQLGDWVQIGDTEGRLTDMNWRAVTVHTRDGNYVLIPNSVVAKEAIVNYHSPSRTTARHVQIGLEYSLPPNDARATLLQAAREAAGVLADPPPAVFLDDYGDSAIIYRIRFWIADPQRHIDIENEVRINAWYRLNQKGYSIPFPIRTVEMIDLEKKTEQLRQRGLSARAAALAKLPILATLSPAQNRHVAEGADDLLLSAGQVVYRQGDVGDRFFVIREGTVDSLLEMPDGRRVSVGTIGSGEFFGEYSAMTGQPRPTTVQAATDVRCIAITRDDLQQIFEADPSAMERVSEVVAKRAAERTQREAAVGGAPQPAEAHERKTVLERMKHSFGRWGL